MLVKVTQEHIDRGVKQGCWTCPIALAIQEVADGNVIVGKDVAFIRGEFYELPIEAQNFVDNFDRGHPVQPFEFEIC